MSDTINDELLERAAYVMEQYTGTQLEDAIAFNIKQNDLRRVEFLVTQAEYELGMEDIHGEGLSCDTY
jgi:hypothetical protein